MAGKRAPKPVKAPGRLARALAAARTACATHAVDAVALAGGGSVVVGVAQIYAPAAWIVAGAMMLGGVYLYARATPELVADEDAEADD